MFLLKESEVVKLAMEKSNMKQSGFAKKINKSQAQVSKYISGESQPSCKTYIHCMNIIKENVKGDGCMLDLIDEVSVLKGEKHKEFRNVLIELIKAYKQNEGSFCN